jgi:hypothetical protein
MDCSIDDDSIAMGNISLRKKNSADRPKKQNSIIHKPSPATTSASTEYKKSRRKPMGEIDGNLQETMMLPEGVDPEAKKDTLKAISSTKNLSSLAVQRPSKKDSDRQRHFPIWFPFKPSLQTNIVPIQGEHVDIPVPEPEWSNEYDPISMDSIQFMPNAADSEFTSFFQNSFTDHKGSDGGSKLNDSSNRNLPMALNSNSVCSSSKDQKKNGSVLPIKVNRGGERTQPLRRGTHKKQRAAHQAASPPSQASHSFSDHSLQCRTREPSPAPKVRQIMGKRVTIIDEELKVFVVDLLTPETCELVRSMTDAHVRQVSENGNQVPTWRTLYTYTKQDLPVCEVKNLNTLVSDEIMINIKAIVGELYQNEKEAQKLRPRSWKGKDRSYLKSYGHSSSNDLNSVLYQMSLYRTSFTSVPKD